MTSQNEKPTPRNDPKNVECQQAAAECRREFRTLANNIGDLDQLFVISNELQEGLSFLNLDMSMLESRTLAEIQKVLKYLWGKPELGDLLLGPVGDSEHYFRAAISTQNATEFEENLFAILSPAFGDESGRIQILIAKTLDSME